MAQIVNKRPVVGSVIDTMDYDYGPRIYDDTYGDHDPNVIASRFHSDDGGMSDSMEQDLSILQDAARKTFAKRKPYVAS